MLKYYELSFFFFPGRNCSLKQKGSKLDEEKLADGAACLEKQFSHSDRTLPICPALRRFQRI